MAIKIISKRCPECKQTKSLSEFSKCKASKDGHQGCCKFCRKIYLKHYHKTAKGKSAQKRYNQSEKYKVAKKRYYQTEKGKAKKKDEGRRYYQSEKGKATKRCYWQSGKSKASRKHYDQTEKGKAVKRAGLKRFYARNPNQLKAVQVVNKAIRDGKLSRPDTLLCHYCPKPAQQYHHHLGYASEHWLDVIPVCTKCHGKCKKKIA